MLLRCASGASRLCSAGTDALLQLLIHLRATLQQTQP